MTTERQSTTKSPSTQITTPTTVKTSRRPQPDSSKSKEHHKGKGGGKGHGHGHTRRPQRFIFSNIVFKQFKFKNLCIQFFLICSSEEITTRRTTTTTQRQYYFKNTYLLFIFQGINLFQANYKNNHIR